MGSFKNDPHHAMQVCRKVNVTWMGLNPPLSLKAGKREKLMGDCSGDTEASVQSQANIQRNTLRKENDRISHLSVLKGSDCLKSVIQ